MPLTKSRNNHTAPGTATGAALGGAVGHHEGHTGTGAVLGGAAGHHFAGNHQQADPAVRPSGIHDPQQMTAQGATTTVDGATIPASGAMNNGNKGSAGEKAFIGKLEHAAGTLLCSSTLKAKGIQKEREAQALRVQSAELSAAERLEQEASARRQRAVAHGAHPDLLNPNPTAAMNNPDTQMAGLNNHTMQPQGNPQYSTANQTSNQYPGSQAQDMYGHDSNRYDGRYPNVAAPLS